MTVKVVTKYRISRETWDAYSAKNIEAGLEDPVSSTRYLLFYKWMISGGKSVYHRCEIVQGEDLYLRISHLMNVILKKHRREYFYLKMV